MTRIIAGRAGGRKLVAPRGDATRPTTDRTKEALFSALADWFGTGGEHAEEQLVGVRVLDLFGGTGAVALEAASRGAELVVTVESGRDAVAAIRKNIESTGLAVTVQQRAVSGFLAGPSQTFDLVYADPPYGILDAEVDDMLVALADGWLAPAALVVVERSKRSADPTWPPQFADSWSRHYGETRLFFGTTQASE